MSHIVIETHGGAEYAVIVTDKDGNNLVLTPILRPSRKQMIVRQELL